MFPGSGGRGRRAGHFLTLCRYVERNALRAALVERAEHWPWSSLYARLNPASPAARLVRLAPWPVHEPADWLTTVNEPQTEAEVQRLRHSARRGCPFGDQSWQLKTAAALGLEASLRPPGRPKKRVPQVTAP
jgi:putative transposase